MMMMKSSFARRALPVLVALLVVALDGNDASGRSTAFQLTNSGLHPRRIVGTNTLRFAALGRDDDREEPREVIHPAGDVDVVDRMRFESRISSRRVAMADALRATSALLVLSSVLPTARPPAAFADDEGVESIAARAARLSREVEKEEESSKTAAASSPTAAAIGGDKTAYDFSVPVRGKQVNVGDFVGRSVESDVPKAFLVVNIKQDDPIARKNIPALISLGARFGNDGNFAVICVPTDQGYYEPDTSALIRLKLASEYGYGINPALLLTDKINLLGTGAHPFMRWIQGKCRTPAGLGKIQGNFEKFLVDGRTGLPVRRYPRKYSPYDIADDIDALVKGKPLPPPGANYAEEWRSAAIEAERDTYRFQKGLNVFDQ